MPETELDRLVAVLVQADPKDAPADVLRRAGLDESRALALCQRPDAVPALLAGAFARHVVPRLPAIVARLADRAGRGDAKAEDAVLSLLGGRSPLREHLSLDPAQASAAGLKDMAKQLAAQLLEASR